MIISVLLVCIGGIAIYTVSTSLYCLPEATSTVARFPAYPGAQEICFTPGEPSPTNTASPFLTSQLSFQTTDSPQDVLHFYRQVFQAQSDRDHSKWRMEDRGSALVFIYGVAPDVLFTNPAEFERNKVKYAPTHVLINTITPKRGWLPWQKTHVDVQIQQVDLFQ
jgi:hypothetical protein